jgi:putative ATP-dependent endonuclease of OLD family
MKLAGLVIKNYKKVGDTECSIKIDEIVILIGRNNSGKSTVLDAYEVFASGGKELDESHFNNEDITKPIEITGIFNNITAEDEDVIGKKWKHDDEQYKSCVKVKWVWKSPKTKAQKQSYNPETNQFEDGGVGGWDTLIQSRIPQPIRIRPTDPIDTTQNKIVGMLKDFVKESLKSDSTKTKAAFEEIERLAKSVFEESKAAFDDVAEKITSNVSLVFPGTSIELIPRSKDAIDEKLVGADSYIKVGTDNDGKSQLIHQGTGLQRAILWSALSVMSDTNPSKKKAKTQNNDATKILLIDEPEAFLHPPTIRNARESLYNFALNNPDWQVLTTTHSPIFIDLSKDHTTIIRVEPIDGEQRFVSTDKVSFDEDERTRLQMIRACNPIVNEFFFYNNIVLVEGQTEQIVINHVATINNIETHVINCMGKANLPLFCRILNQFKVPYLVIHDSDTPKIKRKNKIVNSGTWTINAKIREAIEGSNNGIIFTQFPHFEGEFLGESLSNGKVDRVLEVLSDIESDEYKSISETYCRALKRDASVLTTTQQSFEDKHRKYVADNILDSDPYWTQSLSEI